MNIRDLEDLKLGDSLIKKFPEQLLLKIVDILVEENNETFLLSNADGVTHRWSAKELLKNDIDVCERCLGCGVAQSDIRPWKNTRRCRNCQTQEQDAAMPPDVKNAYDAHMKQEPQHYRNYTIKPHSHGIHPVYVDGRFYYFGWIVVAGSRRNVMPGGTWFCTVVQAQTAIDCLMETHNLFKQYKTNKCNDPKWARHFWGLMQSRHEKRHRYCNKVVRRSDGLLCDEELGHGGSCYSRLRRKAIP